MKILSEKIVNTDEYGGTIDILTGLDDFNATCSYNEEWHTYKINGRIIPSVSKLLDDGSYNDVNEEILKKAQERGKLIHKEIEMYLKSEEMGFTDEFYNFLDIFIENKEKFEKKAIFDIKTYKTATKKNREKCFKQEKLYAEAVKYLTNEEITNFYMIHLPKNEKGKLIDLGKEFENECSMFER
jgi:hypothetical protein